MPRVVVLLLVIVGTCVLAACGGSSADTPAGGSSDPTLAGLIGTPDATQLVTPNLIVMGGTDFPAGKTVRIPFQIYRKDGQLLEPDGGKAQLYLGETATSPALGPYPVEQLSLAGEGVTFDRDDARGAAVLVDGDRHVDASRLHVAQECIDRFAVGHEIGGAHERLNPLAVLGIAMLEGSLHHVLEIDNPDDIIGALTDHRDS